MAKFITLRMLHKAGKEKSFAKAMSFRVSEIIAYSVMDPDMVTMPPSLKREPKEDDEVEHPAEAMMKMLGGDKMMARIEAAEIESMQNDVLHVEIILRGETDRSWRVDPDDLEALKAALEEDEER